MNIKKVNLVIFSPCGGTADATKAIARDITLPVYEYNLTLPGQRSSPLFFTSEDFVLFGFPVYGGRMPANIEKIFSMISGDQTPCALIAVYGNRAYEGAILDLHSAATSKGFNPVAAITAIAQHSLNSQIAHKRPDTVDRDRLAEFGKKIITLAQNSASLNSIPGHYPDWKTPEDIKFFPTTDTDKCNACGVCVNICPTGAVSLQQSSFTDVNECILCGACVKYCAQDARVMITPEIGELFKPHMKEAMRRKEAEIFYG